MKGEASSNRPSKPKQRPGIRRSPLPVDGWVDESARIKPIFEPSKPSEINTGGEGSVNTSENQNSLTSEPISKKTSTRVSTSKKDQGVEGWIEFGGEKHCLRIDAHSLKWSFDMDGPNRPQIAVDKLVQMRGWVKKIWHYEGHTFVANPKTLEIWTEARGKKSKVPWTYLMLADAWAAMDMARRNFSVFQRIALKPKKTDHPHDLQLAHLVIKEKKVLQPFIGPNGPTQVMGGADYFRMLKGWFDAQSAAQIGMTTDKSDPGLVEFNGPRAADLAGPRQGPDHVFLEMPHQIDQIEFALTDHGARYTALEKTVSALEAGQEEIKASNALLMRAMDMLIKKK